MGKDTLTIEPLYDWKINLWKGVEICLYVGIPALIGYFIDFHPAISGITIGAVGKMVQNYLKNRNK